MGGRVRLGLFDQSLEAAEQLQEYRHRRMVHRDRHETVLLVVADVDAAQILAGREKRVKTPCRPKARSN
jgi:hypothetical protein